jgi:hypothetical protein
MTNAAWTFSRQEFNSVDQEVTEDDQFNTEAVPGAEALVREATQNSQDARLKDSQTPVLLRIQSVGPSTGIDASFLRALVEGLYPHLEASRFDPSTISKEPAAALVIEDFGTEGLTGATDDDDDKGNYRSFWFRHGGSSKTGNKNGRWGLGKLVFPMASTCRCFFGLTIREGSSMPLLLGQAVLRTHRLKGFKLRPHGHFGMLKDSRLTPISDQPFIDRFRKGLGLTRKGETGLSVVVPYPAEIPDQEKLLRFVIGNYAYPILTNRLVVEVMGERVDRASIHKIGRDILDPGFIEFIEAIHTAERRTLFQIKEVPYHNGYRLTDEEFGQDLHKLRTKYASGELVGMRLPVKLSRKDGVSKTSHVEIFLRSAGEEQKGGAVVVRGDITVPQEASRFSTKGSFAALLAHDDTASAFLADAENPAHTKWEGTASRLTSAWKYPGQTLTLIRNAPSVIFSLLTSGRDQEEPNALLDFFWMDDPNQLKSTKTRAKKKAIPKDRPSDVDDPGPPSGKKRLTIKKKEGGFDITAGPDFDELTLPISLRVKVAYDVETGNAFEFWDPLDFDFSDDQDVGISVAGAESTSEGNIIEIELADRQFNLTAEGFDPNRDLVVDTGWSRKAGTDA